MDDAALATYLTEKTKFEWTANDVSAVFDGDHQGPDISNKRYEQLDKSMRDSLPEGLFEEVEGYARADFAVYYAASGGAGKGGDPLCKSCGKLFLKYWGKPGEAGPPWPAKKPNRKGA